MVVIAYDIATKDTAGKKRLRRISRKCADWGIAVQNSVYECEMNAEQYRSLKSELEKIFCSETDSIRIYRLGNHYGGRIEVLGKDAVTWDRDTYII